ncbi:MAG: DUF2284 domain-containing protein [Cellulosilyticaceae bacterium]
MEIQLRALCEELEIVNIGMIECSKLVFRTELRDICEKNQCGKYGQSWNCPPAIGSIESVKNKLKQYDKGLIIQTIQALEDCFDLDGMMEGKKIHKEKLLQLLSCIKTRLPQIGVLPLSVGGCEECTRCTYLDGEPCGFPNRAIPGLEGFGIDVLEITKLANLKYNHGPKTVSYVSFIGLKKNML